MLQPRHASNIIKLLLSSYASTTSCFKHYQASPLLFPHTRFDYMVLFLTAQCANLIFNCTALSIFSSCCVLAVVVTVRLTVLLTVALVCDRGSAPPNDGEERTAAHTLRR